MCSTKCLREERENKRECEVGGGYVKRKGEERRYKSKKNSEADGTTVGVVPTFGDMENLIVFVPLQFQS